MSTDRDKARDLAARAYQACLGEDWPAANATMTEAGQQNPNVIALILTIFCDTAIGWQSRMTGMPLPAESPEENGAVRPIWVNADTGQVTMDADELPPAVRWAGRLVAARAARDFDSYQALLKAMPASGMERGAYANALLMGCVSTANLAGRGGAG